MSPKVTGRSLLCHHNPSKLCVEAAWCLYFVLWASTMTIIMTTGISNLWRDVELMILGVVLAVGTFIVPLLLKTWIIHWFVPHVFGVQLSPAQRTYAIGHYERDLCTMTAGVTALSVGLNYLMTPFFFDVLHMRLAFRVTWTLDRNPLFFYWITVAYFSSYSVLGAMLYRWAAATVRGGRWTLRPWFDIQALVMRVAASFLCAFLETLLMANPLIDHMFCYDDYMLTLTFGSFCYGFGFIFVIWSWTSSVPEVVDISKPATLRTRSAVVHAVVSSLGSSVLTTICLYGIRWYIAPLITTVITDSPAFGGCLLKYYDAPPL